MNTTRRLQEKYELQQPIGHGSMAEVWKALDLQLKRPVAIKFLYESRQDLLARFKSEARIVGSLHHPNIVQVYDFCAFPLEAERTGFDKTQAGWFSQPYMVMEYIEGETLATWLNRTSHTGKFPSPSEIVYCLTSICAAIDYAHRHGIVHRDIKPSNILLDKRNTTCTSLGEPRLVDFGLFKLIGTPPGTLTRGFVGTLYYASPEQLRGECCNEYSDIYALGTLFYEMCTGKPPFQGDVCQIIQGHLQEAPVPPSYKNRALPPALDKVILRCLAKEPTARFPTASSLAQAFAQTFNTPLPGQQAVAHQDRNSPPSLRFNQPANNVQFNRQADAAQHNIKRNPIQYPTTPMPQTPIDKPVQQKPLASPHPVVTPTEPLAKRASSDKQSKWLRNTVITILLVLIVALGTGAYRWLTPTSNQTVGSASFMSSMQLDGQNMEGTNDEIQVQLLDIPAPQPGKAYYAWLESTAQSDTGALLLGQLRVNNGTTSLARLYVAQGHENLLAKWNVLLVTEEDAHAQPHMPSPGKKLYYAELSSVPDQRDTLHFSLLNHLQHLLYRDPNLYGKLQMDQGLSSRYLEQMSAIQSWAKEAQSSDDPIVIRQKIINILYALHGLRCAAQDVQGTPSSLSIPETTTISNNARVALIDCMQDPMEPYLTHISHHLDSITRSPGVSTAQRTLAEQTLEELHTINPVLEKMLSDTQQLIKMDDTQLVQQQGTALRYDLNKQAMDAMTGWTDPATGQSWDGSWTIYEHIQQLATFEVKRVTG